MPDPVVTKLAEYGELTRAALDKYLRRPARDDGVWPLLSDYPSRGGKMMRPSLCLATARAFGAPIEAALGCATAIELIHNGMLVHDDIEDDSEMRRGAPTLHELHGIPAAINAGDALLLLALRPLLENVGTIGPTLAFHILVETERMGWHASQGQAMELSWRRENSFDLGDEDYLTMVLKKTSWLGMIYPTILGAIVGTRNKIQRDHFIRFGFFLGAAFQIQDDLLNLSADADYGKERNGDIFEGKRTLMLLHSYRHASQPQQRRIKEILGRPRSERTDADVGWIRGLMDSYGSIEHARNVAAAMAGAALHEFDQTFGYLPDSEDKAFVRALVPWVLTRG